MTSTHLLLYADHSGSDRILTKAHDRTTPTRRKARHGACGSSTASLSLSINLFSRKPSSPVFLAKKLHRQVHSMPRNITLGVYLACHGKWDCERTALQSTFRYDRLTPACHHEERHLFTSCRHAAGDDEIPD